MAGVGTTYTPQTGLTTQGTQLDSAIQTLQGMGQIANPVQGAQQANQATNQAIAAYPQYANNQAAGLYQASNLDPLIQQHGLDLNTFTQMLANDPMGQRYLQPSYASAGPTTEAIGGQPVPGVVSALPQQTLANVNDPYSGATSPMAAMSGENLQAGADVTSLNMLGQTIGQNLSKMQSQLTQNLGGYNTQIQLLQNLSDRYMQQAQYNLQLQQLGLAASPLQQGGGLQSIGSLKQAGLTRKEIQQLYQQAWQGATLTSQQDQIAKAFKTATGYDLFPGKLSSQDEASVKSYYGLLQKVNRVKQYLQTHPNAPVGPFGAMQQMLVNMNWGVGLDPETRQYLADLTSITTGGERQAIAGRLTGYLLDRLKSAFPGPGNSVKQNLELLNNIQQQTFSDLQTTADNASYPTFLDLPGAQGIRPLLMQQLKLAHPGVTDEQIQEYLDSVGQ